MKSGILVLFVSFWLPAALPCSAEELQKELQDFPDANLTEQQWNNRVEDARRNSEQFIAGARMRMSDPVQSDEETSKATDQRALSDPSLRNGDLFRRARDS